MTQTRSASEKIVIAALIAAMYTVLTYVSSALGIAYGGNQFRLSEALCVLAAFYPSAISGLTLGCLFSNIASPLGVVDILFGTLATFLSAVAVRMISKYCGKAAVFIIPIPPTVLNAIIVGLEMVLFTQNEASLIAFLLFALQIAVGEFTVCTVLGIPLYYIVKKRIKK
jgi:uncharacterized membrane protein